MLVYVGGDQGVGTSMATGMPSVITARIGMTGIGARLAWAAGEGGGPEGDSVVHANGDMDEARARNIRAVLGERRGLDIWEE